MKRPVGSYAWIFLLVVAFAAAPGLAFAKRNLCPCPRSHHRIVRRGARASAPAPAAQSVSEPIAGGKTLDHAVSIELNQIYKIDHPMKKGVKDYFSLPLQPGTEITLALKALEKGKSGKPHVQMEVVDPKNQTAASVAVDGQVNEVQKTSFKPMRTGRYVIGVSSTEGDLPKDLVFFKTRSAEAAVECAANGTEPVPIQSGAPHEDCFWKDDSKDVFLFGGRKKENCRIEIALANGETSGLRAQLSLVQKKKSPKIISDVSGAVGKIAMESITLPKKGTYSLEVELLQPSPDVLPYTVTISGATGEIETNINTEKVEKKERAPRHSHHVDLPYYK